MSRLTTKTSIMGRKHDLRYGCAKNWKKVERYYLIENAVDKLGTIENLEEELGIDLITLFKAMKDGIYFTFKHIGNYENYNNRYKNKTYKIIPTLKFYLKENKINWCLEVNHEDWKYCYQVSLKDYKKTWWLEKPKENDND